MLRSVTKLVMRALENYRSAEGKLSEGGDRVDLQTQEPYQRLYELSKWPAKG